MDAGSLLGFAWNTALVAFAAALVVAIFRKSRRRTSTPGPGATGAIYDLLNQDRRNAIELIVEDKAAARDLEHADDTVEDDDPPLADSDARRPH